MNNIPAGPADDERARLDECALEPIRTPGSVQPHGALIAVDAANGTIMFASDNCGEILGTAAAALLGTDVAELVGAGTAEQFSHVLLDHLADVNPLAVTLGGQRFDVIVHRSGAFVVVEFEPSIVATGYQSAPVIYAAIRRLAMETSVVGLWAAVAHELSQLTQFDRVMVYHFHPDGHGEVVAEEVVAGMEPYLGLHYPASDIPAQARDLYLSKLSRLIVSTAQDGAALLASADSAAATSLDLGLAELRSVSSSHLQFMRNMGQASTLSLSLVHDGQLVGMVTCAHRTPHRVPFLLRQGLEILANQVGLQLGSMRQVQRLTEQMHLRALRVELLAQLDGTTDIAALFDGELTVLDLIPAAGAVIRLAGTITTVGVVPADGHLASFAKGVLDERGALSIVSDCLGEDHPELARSLPAVAGVIMVPLGTGDDFLAWFRPEVATTITWLGDQRDSNRATPLSPRNSFSIWTQSVTGRSAAWQGLESEAGELARDLEGVLLRRAESKLASVAMHDPLTGLPNRRYLMLQLEHALAKHARGEQVALLFIDLDGFKSINDTRGHDAGDAVLVHTAEQILATVRAQDTVCRIGGDEFVVLCEDTTPIEAEVVAGRIVDAIRQPAYAAGNSFSITASVGVAVAGFTFSALELLHEADAAMYRAKALGRDQTSR